MGLALIGTWQPGMSVQVYGFSKPAYTSLAGSDHYNRYLHLQQVNLCRKFQVGSPRHNIEFQIDLSCLEKLACLPNWLDNSCFSIAILQPMYLLTPHTRTHTHTCLAIQISLRSSWWCCFYARVSAAVHHTVHIKVWEEKHPGNAY